VVLFLRGLLVSKGRKRAPKMMQFRVMAVMMSKAPLQPYVLMRASVKGANMKVPIPDPQTAMPVANERFFSK
jgi:hypothetical protein